MKQKKKISLLLVVGFSLTLILSAGALSPKSGHAAPAALPATVAMLQIEPGGTSLWTVWYDQPALLGNRAYISHYATNGYPFQVYGVPRSSAILPQSGFAFLPGLDPRYYYATYLPVEYSKNTLLSVAYLNLSSGNTTNLQSKVNLSVCRQDFWALDRYQQHTLVYNPDLNRLYLPCLGDAATGQEALVIDPVKDTITGSLPYVPLAYNPASHRLYALKYSTTTENNNQPLQTFDLLAFDSRTEQPVNDPPLLQNYTMGSGLSSLLVNTRTGDVFVTKNTLISRGSGIFQAAYNKNGQLTQDWSETPTGGFLVLNEANNQLYGKHYNGTYIAVDGNNLKAGQLAAFRWTPLAADTLNNRVYSIDNRDAGSPFFQSEGMGIVIMDGKNFDITDYFPVRPPDGAFIQYANRLPTPPQNLQGIFFQETGHSLSGKFLDFWQAHGGLALFGYPLTEQFLDFNRDDGKIYQVQYFERNRFEYHPENAGTPYEVELGLLGRSFAAVTGPEIPAHFGSGENVPIDGGILFKETGHTLTGKFYAYWQAHGGLALFGLPLTEPFAERNPTDGQTYTVQYFERNRFELHPENAGTPYEVELGLLGTQYLKGRGWLNS